jgi:hypothetical protein
MKNIQIVVVKNHDMRWAIANLFIHVRLNVSDRPTYKKNKKEKVRYPLGKDTVYIFLNSVMQHLPGEKEKKKKKRIIISIPSDKLN